jgi:hypothetical protein
MKTMRVTSEASRSESPNQHLPNNNETNKQHCSSRRDSNSISDRRIKCYNSGHIAKYTNTMTVLQEERTDLTSARTRSSVVSTADTMHTTDAQRTCHAIVDTSNRAAADDTHFDMDAIESYPENPPSTEDTEINVTSAAVAAIDRLQQQPQQHPMMSRKFCFLKNIKNIDSYSLMSI